MPHSGSEFQSQRQSRSLETQAQLWIKSHLSYASSSPFNINSSIPASLQDISIPLCLHFEPSMLSIFHTKLHYYTDLFPGNNLDLKSIASTPEAVSKNTCNRPNPSLKQFRSCVVVYRPGRFGSQVEFIGCDTLTNDLYTLCVCVLGRLSDQRTIRISEGINSSPGNHSLDPLVTWNQLIL
ncbi:hypothetical protein AWENTII_004458 [Aspergillus wentii]